MKHVNSGIWLVLIFLLSQAVRDVFFASTFQVLSFAQVLAPLFLATTLIFAVKSLTRSPEQVALLRAHSTDLLRVNLATAGAWLSYFAALKWLEPALANAFHEGVIPLTLVALISLSRHDESVRKTNGGLGHQKSYMIYGGLCGVLLYLAGVIFSESSGVSGADSTEKWIGVSLALASGGFIAWGILVSKQLNEVGLTPDSIMAVRFIATTIIATALLLDPQHSETAWADVLPTLLLGLLLVVVPLYLFQKAIDLATPITIGVVTSLGPVLIFCVQLTDGRIAFSEWSLAGVVAYSGLAIVANINRGWSEKT